MNEEKTAQLAIAKLEENTGLRLLPSKVNSVLGTGLWADMHVLLEHTKIELVVAIKQHASQINSDTLINQLKLAAGEEYPLLITDYLAPSMALNLKQQGINYLDIAGNAHLNLPPFFVLIEGKVQIDSVHEAKIAKPFSASELKVVFALLANPDLLNANYGEISKHANVALGVVGTIVRELKDQGFFIESGSPSQRRWQYRQKLIARWVEEYPKLRDTHYIGTYFTANPNWWQSNELEKYGALLGGDFAAVYYSKNARPMSASIYLDEHQQWEFLRKLHFTQLSHASENLPNGVKVFSKFWGEIPQQIADCNVTHPLITYADLLTIGNPENRAVANEIAKRYFG